LQILFAGDHGLAAKLCDRKPLGADQVVDAIDGDAEKVGDRLRAPKQIIAWRRRKSAVFNGRSPRRLRSALS
jgi:hypothetical protein